MKAESGLIAFICAALTRRLAHLPPGTPSLELCRPLAPFLASKTAFHNPPFYATPPSSLYNCNCIHQSNVVPTTKRQETHNMVIMTRHINSAKSVTVFWPVILQGFVKWMYYIIFWINKFYNNSVCQYVESAITIRLLENMTPVSAPV